MKDEAGGRRDETPPAESSSLTQGTSAIIHPSSLIPHPFFLGGVPPVTKGEQFAGLTVALVTPFKGDDIDFDALGRLVDWHVEQGTDCLSPVGTTGEAPTLSHEEHE